ncbi:hypothetical protein HNY73_000052 [Argiope bruennichi]|uniref:Uncharacterized protein n=1 Tax=Argiope bruennichi TaxID=94029 RepID=A0A8T0G2S8_ARGBR|nr:hypothetical protein HNY73_000052 [Argiope bruennichi]
MSSFEDGRQGERVRLPSYGISGKEIERRLDLFDESTGAELSKLAEIGYVRESFKHEAATECFDTSFDWVESLLLEKSIEGADSLFGEGFF